MTPVCIKWRGGSGLASETTAADGELRGDEWHVCVGVLGCVHLSARMHVRVCVSVFMHLCLCVSKGVYAVHCHAHFPLLHVWSYNYICYSCVYVQVCVIGDVCYPIPPCVCVNFIILHRACCL